MTSSAGKDCITWESLYRWGECYCPDVKTRRSEWVSPGQAPTGFWSNSSLPSVIDPNETLTKTGILPKETLVLFGSDEVMRDDIMLWIQKVGLQSSQIVEESSMVHGSVINHIAWQNEEELKVNSSLRMITECLQKAIQAPI